MNLLTGNRSVTVMLLAGALLTMTACGSNHIWQAAEFGQYNEVQRMLDEKPELLNAQDSAGWTPLIHAVHGQKERVVQLLLDRGADPTIKAGSNWDAWHEARAGDKSVIKKMIKEAVEKHEAGKGSKGN